MCGLSGKLLNQDDLGWDRISGLDPAGPLFFNEHKPSPSNKDDSYLVSPNK